jgi:predicted acetyltransferase
MSASYPIRPISMPELPEFLRVGDHAFNSSWPFEKFLEFERQLFEPERSLAGFDQDEIIGTAMIMSFDLIVPGGEVSAAGVTGVAVLPSHRRRGVLTSLMKVQLTDIAAGAEPVAALFASESAIYGRYGYGTASGRFSYVIKRGEGLPDVRGEAPALRLVDQKAGADAMKSVFDAIRVTRPGMMTRSQAFWDAMLADPEWARQDSSPKRYVLAEGRSAPRGYAIYSTKQGWSEGLPTQTLNIHELFGLDLAATAALWADLLSRDLVSEVNVWSRPVDDPLLHQLPDPRRARASYRDGLWIRLIDLPTALMQRSYSAAVDVVIEVTDQQLPANAGRWRLQAGGRADEAKPSCERTTDEPDLAMPVAALGAAYLGGTRLGGLAAAGIITELSPGALAALSTAMWWDPAPWAATFF